MKGLSYEGVVDITRETKETGQALKAHLTGGFETGADVSTDVMDWFLQHAWSGPLLEEVHWGKASEWRWTFTWTASQRLGSSRQELRPHSWLCQQSSWCCYQVDQQTVNSCVEMMRLILTGITKMERWVFKSDLRMISPQEMRFRQRKRRLRKLWKNEIWCSNLFCDKQFLKYIFPQNIHYFVDGKNIYTVQPSDLTWDCWNGGWEGCAGPRRLCFWTAQTPWAGEGSRDCWGKCLSFVLRLNYVMPDLRELC